MGIGLCETLLKPQIDSVKHVLRCFLFRKQKLMVIIWTVKKLCGALHLYWWAKKVQQL